MAGVVVDSTIKARERVTARAVEPMRAPDAAEAAATALAGRLWRGATRAVREHVEATWPRTTEAGVRRAIIASLPDRRRTLTILRAVALGVQRNAHVELVGHLGPLAGRWKAEREADRAGAWAADVWAELVAALLGPGYEDPGLHADAKKRRPTLLDSTMGRLRAKRASNAEILDVLSDLREVAPAEEHAAIVRVRNRVLLYASRENRRRQQDAGVKRYLWVTMGDSRVRPGHARLNGTIQRWAKPPDVGGGKRCHPGEDFGCRCQAIPILSKAARRRLGADE